MTVGSVTGQPQAPETEARLAGFAELVAAAIANADAREELRRVADEQAALRRVATLVAHGAAPDRVFAVVAEEIGALFGADITSIIRFDADGDVTLIGGHGVVWREQGTRFKPYPGSAIASVRATGRATRLDADGRAAAVVPHIFRTEGVHSAVNAPVVVEGTIWGTVGVASRRGRLPVDTEQRLAGFTELVATAIANAQARTELRGFADEQAALRRVATLVARGAPPEEVFAAVAAEVTRVIDVDVSFLSRYARDGTATVVAVGPALPSAVPAGTQFAQGGRNIHTLVFTTGQPARIEGYAEASGPAAGVARETGVHSAVGVPITVEGQLWGVMAVANTHDQLLPTDTEARLAGFTELVGHRDRQRAGADRAARLRRRAGGAAPGGDAGRPRAAPQEVFAAVTAEAGRAVSADFTSLWRYDPDGAVTAVGNWGADRPYPMPVGTWLPPAEPTCTRTCSAPTGRPGWTGSRRIPARGWRPRSRRASGQG